jgi:chaperonin cofactor prefoldin
MIQLWMVFEAVAAEKGTVDSSLDQHVDGLEEAEGVEILEKEYDEAEMIENPHPGLEEGFSKVCEIRAEVESFPRATEICVNYGPTYVQVEGPEKLEMSLKETQESLQKMVETMHQYAQMGVGGVLVSNSNEEEE